MNSPTVGIAVVGDWPLTGRELDLAAARANLHARASAGVVLAGPAGVGKSRLAREALEVAARAGASTTWAAATRATSKVPFGALLALLPEQLPPATDQLALFRAIARSFADRSNGGPLVVAIDDAHLLDDAGAGLIHQLAVTGIAQVVLTVRTGEPTPDPVRAIWKDHLAPRMELQPLARSDVDELVQSVLGHQVAQASLDRLWSVTGGNALFLHELVLDTLEAGGFDTADGVMVWRRALEPGHRLDDLLGSRLGNASPEAQACAQMLALGEPLGVAVLEQLGPPEALQELEAAGLVRLDKTEHRLEVRLTHPLYAEILRSQLRPLAGRDLRRRLAVTLAEAGTLRRGDLLRLATLELDADLAPPSRRALAAAAEANRSCDYVLAERLAVPALLAEETAAARLALGEALNGQGRYHDAEEMLAPAEGLPASDGQAARIAEQRAEALHWGLGREDEASEVLLRAERSVADPASRQYLQAVRASCLTSSARHDEAYALAAPLLDDPGGDETAQLRAVVAVGTALSLGGRTTDALAMCDRMLEPALRRSKELPSGVGWVVFQRLLALTADGRLDQAEQLSRTAYAVAVADRNDEARGALSVMIGRIDMCRGHLHRAEEVLREGAAMLALHDREHYRGWCLSLVAQVVAQRGDADTAAALVDEVDGGPVPTRVAWTDVVSAQAWAMVAGGAVGRGQQLLLDGAAQARSNGLVIPEALLLHEAQRTGAPATRVADRLATLATDAQSRFLATWARHARGAADAEAPVIEDAAARFEQMGMQLLAAEAWAGAADARCLAHDHVGSARSAARSQVMLAGCPGAVTPLLAALGAASRLTRREREVASLAARGWSSRAIADELVVSVRTVDGHLAHVYRKLGVIGRDELAPLLTENR